MFLSTSEFKILDMANCLAPGISLDACCKLNGCKIKKLVFPYEWMDCYKKLNHLGPVNYEDFYSSLKGGIYLSGETKYYNENKFHETVQKEFGINLSKTQIDKTQRKMIENGLGVNLDKIVYNKDLYDQFVKDFHDRGCVTMKDWLREYNLVDVIPFTEFIKKTKQYYTKLNIDLFKDAVSIPGISYRHVINTYIKNKSPSDPDLYTPGQPCTHTCNNQEPSQTLENETDPMCIGKTQSYANLSRATMLTLSTSIVLEEPCLGEKNNTINRKSK